MQVLSLQDFTSMRWKNGLGTTVQFIIEPSSCTMNDPFTFRISSAIMTTSGPFSQFSGYSRILFIMGAADGEGHALPSSSVRVVLTHHGTDRVELKWMEPYEFSGSVETVCELVEPCEMMETVSDFNVMVREDRAECQLCCCETITHETVLNLGQLRNEKSGGKRLIKNAPIRDVYSLLVYVTGGSIEVSSSGNNTTTNTTIDSGKMMRMDVKNLNELNGVNIKGEGECILVLIGSNLL